MSGHYEDITVMRSGVGMLEGYWHTVAKRGGNSGDERAVMTAH